MQIRPSNQGNILFLILLAIVLFAALATAVVNNIRGGGKDSTDEKAQAGASALMNYMTSVKTEVQRLMLVNGCSITNLDWREGAYKRYNNALINANAPLNPKTGCAVFQSQGGAIAPQDLSKYEAQGYSDYMSVTNPTNFKSGHFAVRWVSMVGQGTSRSDIALIAEGMDLKICELLARQGNSATTTLVSDTYNNGATYTSAEPTLTADTDIIGEGNKVQNQNDEGLFFTPVNSACRFGYILIPQ